MSTTLSLTHSVLAGISKHSILSSNLYLPAFSVISKPIEIKPSIWSFMGHSDISVTMNVYTHIGFDDAEEELKRMEEFRKAQAEVEQKKEKPMSQKMFKVV